MNQIADKIPEFESQSSIYQDTYRVVRLSEIRPGNNPRKKAITPESLAELVESVASVGVAVPILLRELGQSDTHKYEIIAGERRYRASVLAFGEQGEIPAMIRVCDDETYDLIALIENVQREAMSVTDESDAVAKILYSVAGDKEEACRILGFSMKKLTNRLAFQNLVAEVKQALNDDKIKLGHAELLAGVAQVNQPVALQNIITHNYSVAQTKELLTSSSQRLASAIFNKDQCAGCIHNSEQQLALLDTSIGAGYCTNRDCFSAKTEEEIQLRAKSLEEEVPKVTIIRDLASGRLIIPVSADSVGQEQFTQCQACGEFGASISAMPDTLGQVKTSQCANVGCNSQKVAQKALADKPVTTATPSTPAKGAEGVKSSIDNAGKVSTVSAPTQNNRAKEFKENTWRSVAANEVFGNPKIAQALLCDLALTGRLSQVPFTKVRERSVKLLGKAFTGSMIDAENLAYIDALTQQQIDSISHCTAASAMFALSFSEVEKIVAHYGMDLMKYWRVSEKYLELFTKSELQSMMEKSHLTKLFEDDKAYKKAIGGKKEELIKAILALPVQWSSFTPEQMSLPHHRKLAKANRVQSEQPQTPISEDNPS